MLNGFPLHKENLLSSKIYPLPKEEILWLWPPSVMSDDGVQIRVSINQPDGRCVWHENSIHEQRRNVPKIQQRGIQMVAV